MRLISLELKAFRLHAHTVIHFPRVGTCAFVGANSAGKSSLLEAIAYGLYGLPDSFRGAKSTLRWRRAPKHRKAEITLTIEVRGEQYIIRRTETDAQVFPGSVLSAPVAAGTAAVNAFVPRLLGLSLDEFKASLLCSQKDLERLVSMKPTERETFFRSVMGIGRIDKALELCRARARDLKQECAGAADGLGEREPLVAAYDQCSQEAADLSTKLGVAKREHDRARQAAADAAEELGSSDHRRRQHDALQQRITEEQRNLAIAEAAGARITAELQQANEAAAKVLRLAHVPDEIKRLRAQRDELRDAKARAGQRAILTKTIAEMEAERERLGHLISNAQAAIEAYRPELLTLAQESVATTKAELERMRDERRTESANLRAAIGVASEQMATLQSKVDLLDSQGATGSCPTCTRALAEQFENVIEALTFEIDVVAGRQADARARLTSLAEPSDAEAKLAADLIDLEEILEGNRAAARIYDQAVTQKKDSERALAGVEEKLSTARATLSEIPELSADHTETVEDVERRLGDLEAIDRGRATARATADRFPALTAESFAAGQAIKQATDAISDLNEAVNALGFDASAHAQLEARVAQLREARDQAATAEARLDESTKAALLAVTRAEAALRDYDARAAKLKKLQADFSIHEGAARALDRFRDEQVSGLRPELEEYMSGYISILTDGRFDAVTVDEQFTVTLIEDGVPVPVVSGGTEDLIAIAFRLSVAHMIARRMGEQPATLMMDEVMGSLDQVWRGNVLNLLTRLRGTFEQLILISHIEETKTAADVIFDVTFDQDNDCSRVRCSSATETEPAHVEVAA